MPEVQLKDLPKPTEEEKHSALLETRFEKRFEFRPPAHLLRSMSLDRYNEAMKEALSRGVPPNSATPAPAARAGRQLSIVVAKSGRVPEPAPAASVHDDPRNRQRGSRWPGAHDRLLAARSRRLPGCQPSCRGRPAVEVPAQGQSGLPDIAGAQVALQHFPSADSLALNQQPGDTSDGVPVLTAGHPASNPSPLAVEALVDPRPGVNAVLFQKLLQMPQPTPQVFAFIKILSAAQ